MKSLNPRIIRRKDGSALLTGLSYSDLCHILTLASIQQHDAERRHEENIVKEEASAAAYRGEGDEMMAEIVMENLQDKAIFHRRIRATLDLLKGKTSPRYTGDDGPVSAISKLSVKMRLENAKYDRSFRQRMREIFSTKRAEATV